jgi:hypothetical protein
MRSVLCMGVVGALLVAAPAAAEAQQDGAEGKVRIGVGPSFGFGGEAALRTTVPVLGRVTARTDLRPTVGLTVFADYPVHRYVAVGLHTRILLLRTKDFEDDVSTAFDISPMVRGRYPFKQGEVYMAIPFGLSVQTIDDDINPNVDNGVGWNMSLLFGGQFHVTDLIGVYGHMGGMFRGTHHATPGDDLRVRTKQFVLEVGVAFLL